MQIYRCALVFAARTESDFCKRPRAAAADGVTLGAVFTADWVGAPPVLIAQLDVLGATWACVSAYWLPGESLW
jgi:hypothetical protein